jgi:hypothetical protein
MSLAHVHFAQDKEHCLKCACVMRSFFALRFAASRLAHCSSFGVRTSLRFVLTRITHRQRIMIPQVRRRSIVATSLRSLRKTSTASPLRLRSFALLRYTPSLADVSLAHAQRHEQERRDNVRKEQVRSLARQKQAAAKTNAQPPRPPPRGIPPP